jgi:hypothetical protein
MSGTKSLRERAGMTKTCVGMTKCRVCGKHYETRPSGAPSDWDRIVRLCGEQRCVNRFFRLPTLLGNEMPMGTPIDEFLKVSKEDHYRIRKAGRVSQRLGLPHSAVLRALADDARP